MKKKHPYGNYEFYVPPERRYPDYRVRGAYDGFDPMNYCHTLRQRVKNGELTWDRANAMWRAYARSVEMIYTDQPKPGPCVLADSLPAPFFFFGAGAPGSVKAAFPIWG